MVLKLAERLEVPLRERNVLLVAAGFAPAFPQRSLDDPALKSARQAIDLVLKAHEPNPALAYDRHWNLVTANRMVAPLLEGLPPHLLGQPFNILRLAFHPEGLAPRTVNLAEWSAHLLERLHRQCEATADPELLKLYQELKAYRMPARSGPVSADNVAIPFKLRRNDEVLSFISTTMVFGTPVDITLQELALETFFPADDLTAERMRQIAASLRSVGRSEEPSLMRDGFRSLYPSCRAFTAPRPSHNRRMDSRQHAPLPANPVGDLLRGWRNRRAMSQADLAFEAGISIKHLSYVETGKAAGSRDILLQLASALGLSLRDRNALLEAGGFARQYGERDLSAPEVADAKRAIDLLLRRHEPFPAIVTDRRWNVMQANRAAVRLMTMLLGEERMTRPLNHMRMFLAPDELRPFVVDWPDVAAALLARARHEAMAAPLDLALQSTWRELLKLPDVAVPQLNEDDAPGPLCEVRLRKGDISIGLIGAVLTLGTPQDVTLQELRVEMFMPADEASEALLVKLGR